MDKIAVLMSTYNGEQFIREQIDSILLQKGDFQLDLWVRDDGSKDGTQNILKEYESKGKLKWYTGENKGPAYSFIDLLNHCKNYDFYAFADQDDFWDEDKINIGIKEIETYKKPALYCCNAELVDFSLKSLGRNVYIEKPKLDFYTLSVAGGLLGCTMIFNKYLASYIPKQLPQKIILHDFYMAELCSLIDGDILYDENPHMKYRQHGNNVVGVSHGIIGTIKSRISDILTTQSVSIADQALELNKLKFINDVSFEKREWLNIILNYRKNIFSRLKLALSTKTNYINFNMGLKLRMSILFNNR